MKKPSPKTLALVSRTVLGIVLLASAGAIMAYLVATRPQISKSQFEEQSVRVQVIRVEPIKVARQWRGYGTTRPAKERSADIPAQINATVQSIPKGIEVGRVVKKNDIIAELDKTDFKNAFNAADKRMAEVQAAIDQLPIEERRLKERLKLQEKAVKLAQDEYDKQVERKNTGSATQSDVDRFERALIAAKEARLGTQQQIELLPKRKAGLEATLAAVKAERDTADANLKRATIKSPIDGIIESLNVETGENLAPGAIVARVIDPRVLEVPLQLPASARNYINLNQAEPVTVTLTIRNPPEGCPPWTAKVTRLAGADGPTRTFVVFAEVDQSTIPLEAFATGGGTPHKLPVGAFTLAKLDTTELEQRIVLPARSVQQGRVRIVVDGKVVSRDIDVAFDLEKQFPRFGVPDNQWQALSSGLKGGELVVLSASMSILDGQRVEAVVANPADKDKPAKREDGGSP